MCMYFSENQIFVMTDLMGDFYPIDNADAVCLRKDMNLGELERRILKNGLKVKKQPVGGYTAICMMIGSYMAVPKRYIDPKTGEVKFYPYSHAEIKEAFGKIIKALQVRSPGAWFILVTVPCFDVENLDHITSFNSCLMGMSRDKKNYPNVLFCDITEKMGRNGVIKSIYVDDNTQLLNDDGWERLIVVLGHKIAGSNIVF